VFPWAKAVPGKKAVRTDSAAAAPIILFNILFRLITVTLMPDGKAVFQ
jgi:hypothetical protein